MHSNKWRSGRGYGGRGHGGAASAQQVVPLPPGMPGGAVIGRGGANVKLLAQRSGARFALSAAGDAVTVSGSAGAVEAGVALLRGQIDAFVATGGSYPHPLATAFLLADSFGAAGSTPLVFVARDDDVARATKRRERLYALQPGTRAPAPAPAGGDAAALTASLGRMALGSSSSSSATELFTWTQLDKAVGTVVAAAAKGAAHRPAFDEVKLRFNFGKQLFYNGPSADTCWSINDMRAKRVPQDYKAVFSNAVPPSRLPALQDWLTSRLGFQQSDSKETMSVTLVHRSTNASYSLSFIKYNGASSGLVLRKAKSSNSKLAFLSLLAPPSQVDWRAKLLAQYRFAEGSDAYRHLLGVAASAQLAGGSSLQLPGLREADLALDKERHKSKAIFQGRYAHDNGGGGAEGTLIKVTLSRVAHAGVGDVTEVAGTSPQLNALLAGLLAPGGGPLTGEAAAAASAHLRNMLAFAADAAAVMAADGE